MILEKRKCSFANRELMGATNPKEAKENTIRKLLVFRLIKTLFMDLTQLDNAKKEIDFFF